MRKAVRILGVVALSALLLFLAFLLIGDTLHRHWLYAAADLAFLYIGWQWLRDTLAGSSVSSNHGSVIYMHRDGVYRFDGETMEKLSSAPSDPSPVTPLRRYIESTYK